MDGFDVPDPTSALPMTNSNDSSVGENGKVRVENSTIPSLRKVYDNARDGQTPTPKELSMIFAVDLTDKRAATALGAVIEGLAYFADHSTLRSHPILVQIGRQAKVLTPRVVEMSWEIARPVPGIDFDDALKAFGVVTANIASAETREQWNDAINSMPAMARHRRLTERESKGGSNYNLDETIPTEAKQKKLAGSERTQTASEVLRKRVFGEVGELLNTTAPRSATDLRSAAKSIDLTDAALVANGIDPDSMALEPLLGFVENLTARREDRAAFIEALQDRADIPLELKVSVFVRVACNISMPHLARRDSLTAAVNLLANSTASSRLTTAFHEVLGNLVRNKSDRRMGAAVLGFVARQKFPIETACWLVEQVDPMLMRAHGIESPEVQQLKYAYDDARAFLEQSPKTSAATR